MVDKARYLRFFKRNRKIVLVIFLVFILNILAVGLWYPFLSEGIWVFYGKSQVGVLSDLLFLEGAIIFAVSAFAAAIKPWVSRASRRVRERTHIRENLGTNVKSSLENQIDFWTLMIIIGAFMIGSAIAIGLLLL